MPQDAKLLVEILRAAGHDEAARLATAVLRPDTATEDPTDDTTAKPDTTPAADQRMFSADRFANQDAERAAGQQLLDHMRASGIDAANGDQS